MTPTRLLPLLIAAAFAALIPLPAAADVFGPVGVVAGQTVRVTAVNREAPGAASCRVELSFRDASGQLFLNGDGQPQVTQLTLAPGVAGAFELAAPASATGAASRVAVRPVLRRLVPPNPCRLLRDAEVFDSASGLTRVAWPPSPIIPSEPLYPPGPMFGLVNGQTARFTVVSLLPAGSRQAPVQLELSFVGADGATLLNGDGQPLVSRVALAPAASASLDVVYPPGPITPQRLNLRPVLKRFLPGGPTTPLVATTEVFDSVSGVTAFVVPPTRSTDDADD